MTFIEMDRFRLGSQSVSFMLHDAAILPYPSFPDMPTCTADVAAAS